MAAAKRVVPFSATPEQVHKQIQQGGPFVHPSVAASNEAQAYAAGLAARQQGRPFQKYTAERPTATVPMPPLEQAPVSGVPMAQQAGMYGPHPGELASLAARPGSIVEGPTPVSRGAQPAGALQLTDSLPPEAMEDPAFIQGQGSMVAANQPQLAAKYGVIRNGARISPAALQGQPQGRRSMQDTLKDLGAIASAQKAVEVDSKEAPKNHQEEIVNKPITNVSEEGDAGDKAARNKKIEEAIEKMDDFDYDELRRQMSHDNLNNPEQRRIIESRLQPLDIAELIQHDRVIQEVPIIPGKFWITFQSLTGDDDMELKRLIMAESKKIEVTDRYLLDKYAFMSLTAGIIAINGRPVPYNQYDADGDFNAEKFWLKFHWVMRRPLHMLSSIGVNHTWFELRVRKLFEAEKVKNG